jgi:hypothetical protein
LGPFTLSQFHNNYTPKTGEETFFKIKKSTRMQKVFDTYAQRKGIQASSLRFLLDGEKIGPDQTPKMLELDDQDQIDCMLEQVCREQVIEGNLCRNVLLSIRMPVHSISHLCFFHSLKYSLTLKNGRPEVGIGCRGEKLR